MNLVIFGPQGSGKGTQAELLAKKYNLQHIETGQIFREIAKENTSLGKMVADTIHEKKDMVPDEITVDILRKQLEKVPMEKGVLLDSAPRTMGQIDMVENMLRKIGRSFDKAIYIELPYEESIERISKRYMCPVCFRHFVLRKDIDSPENHCPTCHGPIIKRCDDTPEGIAKRLKVFYEVTIPVIEYYREKGILVEVDGRNDVDKVFENITNKLQ